MSKTTKVVEVPVAIVEEDKTLQKIKYRALDKVMQEARFLGNMAIRYAIAFRLDKIPAEVNENGKRVPLDRLPVRLEALLSTFAPADADAQPFAGP